MAPQQSEYDFIVVGGGTAGPVVASRLTENPNISVLLVEAGSNALQDPRIAIPAMWSSILGSELDWDFLTTPQEHLNGRQVGQPQGRLLGGGSGLNAEVFVPPSAAGFDSWERSGNQGWGWEAISPYFRKFHTLNSPDAKICDHLKIDWVDSDVNGSGGPVQACFTDVAENPLGKAWIDTFDGLGLPLTSNPFSGRGTGAFSCPASIDPVTKTRSYAASAYYAPASGRSNLELLTNATVTQVELDDEQNSLTARGVVLKTQDGTEHRIKAKREVVLAAGVFQTPKLLELSGIGSKEVLDKAGITCKLDNPNVGENLQDHLMTGVSFEVAEGVMTGDCLLRQEPGIINTFMQMYQEHKAGPFASGSLSSYAYVPVLSAQLEKLDPKATRNALQTAVKEAKDSSGASKWESDHVAFLEKLLGDDSEASGSLFTLPAQVNLHNGPRQIGMTTNPVQGNYLSLGASLLHPLSRGSSHISSSDPAVHPTIDPRYLSSPLDLEIFARHLMALEVIAKSEPLARFLKPDGRRAQPSPNGGRADTLEKAKEYVRETALSNNHPVGTCAMLPRDNGGVVDTELKVYGVQGLRIVDSSMMPFVPRANTQTTVYAVAEKAADIIKAAYGI